MKVLIKKTNKVEEVKNSYAVNYLIPKGLAVVADKKVMKRLEQAKEEKESDLSNKREKELVFAKKIDGKSFEIKVKANQSGELFGAVGKPHIKKLLKTKVKVNIILRDQIKHVGEYDIPLKVGETRVKIHVGVVSNS